MKQLLVLLLFLCSIGASAQDVIVKKDGSTILCRVVEVNSSEIIYKRWSDLDGSNYVMNRTDASVINYESGKRENLGEMTNLYAPSNQSDGIQQFNDQTLLRANDVTNAYKNAKRLRNAAWIGGGLLFAGGAFCLLLDGDGEAGNVLEVLIPACFGGSVVWTTSLLIAANHVKKQGIKLQAFSIYQHEFKLKNGTVLTPSLDLYKDRMLNTQTIGIGLSYNF